MTGLVLEGGGAKGAFHIGAIKALREEGYNFDIVAGTSVGAMNGALVAQGDFDVALKWWEQLDSSILFDSEGKNTITDNAYRFARAVKSFVSNGGLDTSKIRKLLREIIDEEKFRASSVDFGMVTISLTQRKPFELYKDDIPKGKLVDYLMASGNMPVFKIEPIDGNIFIDGSFYNNCPVNMPIRRGCDKIIVIKTYPLRPIKNYPKDNVEMLMIKPSNGLGGMLDFNRLTLSQNLKLGYCETRRTVSNLRGKWYYIDCQDEDILFQALVTIPDSDISVLEGHFLNVTIDKRRLLMEYIVPRIAKLLNLSNKSYTDIIIGLMEHEAEKRGIDRLKVYSIKEFAKEIYNAPNTFSPWEMGNSFISASSVAIAGEEYFISQFCNMVLKNLIIL